MPKYEARYPIVAEASSTKMVNAFNRTYPNDFKLIHRVVLHAGGSDYDFTGYFLMRRPGLLIMSAFAEAGAPIFEIQKNMNGVKVVKQPAPLPEIVITAGVVKDLLHIYDSYRDYSWRLVSKTDSTRTFQVQDGDKNFNEFSFLKNGTLINSLRVAKDKIVSKVTYDQPKKILGAIYPPMPTHLIVENLEFSYRMDIQVVEASAKLPSTFDDIIFETTKGTN